MTTKKIIELGRTLGLEFNEQTNYSDALKHGRVVFDGCNGQRFIIESSWSDDTILSAMGKSLILLGRRQKCVEINNVLSIHNDN